MHKTPITVTGIRMFTRNLSDRVALNHLRGPLTDFTKVAALTIFVSIHLTVIYATEIVGVA